MPRRGNIAKRDVLPDPLYNSKLVTRLINNVMLDGKKGVAQKIVYGAFDIVRRKNRQRRRWRSSSRRWKTSCLCLKSRPAVSAVPPIRFRWRSVRKDGRPWVCAGSPPMRAAAAEKTMKERLAGEILDAMNGTGGACKKREDTHKMAEANKAFAHYRW